MIHMFGFDTFGQESLVNYLSTIPDTTPGLIGAYGSPMGRDWVWFMRKSSVVVSALNWHSP